MCNILTEQFSIKTLLCSDTLRVVTMHIYMLLQLYGTIWVRSERIPGINDVIKLQHFHLRMFRERSKKTHTQFYK